MNKRAMALSVACLMLLCVSQLASAGVRLVRYPRIVCSGETINVKVSWAGVPLSKDYVVRAQLEDWQTNPPLCIFNDVPITRQGGEANINLAIPATLGETKKARFMAVVLSKSKNWSDTFAVAETDKNIVISRAFRLSIVEFPKSVKKGSNVKVKVSWKDVTAGKDYKVIVQLENWDEKPGFAYAATIEDVKASGEAVVEIKIPLGAKPAKNCNFTAAFISKTKNWNDTFSVVTTEKDVEIK